MHPQHRDEHDREPRIDLLAAAGGDDELREQAAATRPEHASEYAANERGLQVHARVRHEHVEEAEPGDHEQVRREARQPREPCAEGLHLLQRAHRGGALHRGGEAQRHHHHERPHE